MFLTKQSPREVAEKCIAGGKYDRAIPILIELYRARQPIKDKCRAGTKLADTYLKSGNKERALDIYREVAELFGREGFLIQAIAMNKIILSISPYDATTQSLLTTLYSQRGIDYNAVRKPSSKNRLAAMHSDDHLPPPTPFMEIEAEPDNSGTVQRQDVDGLVRNQLVIKHQLPKYPLFSDLSESEFAEVITIIERIDSGPNGVVFSAGDAADALYIISEGEILVYTDDRIAGRTEIKRLGTGEFFGEFGLLSQTTRSASCMTTQQSVLLKISKEHFERIIKKFPRIQTVLESFYRERILDTLAAESLIFRNLEPAERKEIIAHFAMKAFKKGHTIVNEGDRSTSFYFIKRGLVEISKQDSGSRKVLAIFKPGMFFGEVAMLTGKPRTASATCLMESEIFEITKDDFEAITVKYPTLRNRLSEIAVLRAPNEAGELMHDDDDLFEDPLTGTGLL